LPKPSPTKVKRLRAEIRKALVAQGFELRGGLIVPPDLTDKQTLRDLHASAVAHRIRKAEAGLRRHETFMLKRLARPAEISIEDFHPRLIPVLRGSPEELLFRWARLHWSIPVSSGYGRRLRFIVEDASNGKLVGLIGLGDPVFSLAARDNWVGWTIDQRRRRLHHVVDAFVLGAVPPYSYLLAGKLVAMLAASDEVQTAWMDKYAGSKSLIAGKRRDGRLALITTTSALGRSSLYNRLSFDERKMYLSVGETRGSGEFHFSDGLHRTISEFAVEHCVPTAKNPRWGDGFRNRREMIKKALPALGFSDRLLYHGVRREMFVVPLGGTTTAFLRGEVRDIAPYAQSVEALAGYFRERWLTARAEREKRHLHWSPESWRLWPAAD
jgi:hypothetical protein